MAQSPLEQVIRKWEQRQSQAPSSLPAPAWQQLAAGDIAKVAAGHSPMSDIQAQAVIQSLANRTPVLQDPAEGTHPQNILGNAVKDIQQTAVGFFPGIARFLWHLPEESRDTYRMLTNDQYAESKGAESLSPKHTGSFFGDIATGDFGDVSRQLRNASRLPLAPLVPGLHTAAAVTSAEGRQTLEQHPLGTALDVLPYVSKLTSLASSSEAASVSEQLDKARGVPSPKDITDLSSQYNVDPETIRQLARMPRPQLESVIPIAGNQEALIHELLANKPPETPELAALEKRASVYDALKGGHPFKAISRQTGLSDFLSRGAASMGLSSDIVELSRGESQLRRSVETSLRNLVNSDTYRQVAAIPDHLASTFWQLVHDPRLFDSPDLAPELHTQATQDLVRDVRSKLTGIEEELAAKGHLVAIPIAGGHSVYYEADSPIVKQWGRLNEIRDKIATGEAKQADWDKANERLQTLIRKPDNVPPAFRDHVAAQLRQRGIQAINDPTKTLVGRDIQGAIDAINKSTTLEEMKHILGQQEYNAIIHDTMAWWVKARADGLDPKFVIPVSPSQIRSLPYLRALRPTLSTPAELRRHAFDLSPSTHDVALALTATAKTQLAIDASAHFANQFVNPFTRTVSSVAEDLRQGLTGHRIHSGIGLEGEVQRQMTDKYAVWDTRTGRPTGDAIDFNNVHQRLMPKYLAHAITTLYEGKGSRLPVDGIYDKIMREFRLAVLTGPRHIAHIAFGGMMMAVLREPGSLLDLREAYKAVADGRIPNEVLGRSELGEAEIAGHVHPPRPNADQIWSMASAKTMWRWFTDSVGDKVKAVERVEQHISNVQRAAVFLHATERGLNPEEAMRQVYRTFVDMDGMTPLERTVLKNIFPFYGFTKHVLRYVLTYPADYPFRAAILSNISRQEMDDWNSGLPQKFQTMFYLGEPDSKGNVHAVDVRAFNPFRSLANAFTIQGLVSNLNPLISGFVKASGADPLTGTPELYPATTYDPVTGSIASKRTDTLPKIAEEFVPQLGTLDHFIHFTDQMRKLRQSNPAAFERQLYSSLNMPFSLSTINLTSEQARTTMNKLRQAQTDITRAEQTGEFGPALRWNLVPYQGRLVDPVTLAGAYEEVRRALAAQGVSGISPKAVTIPRRSKPSRRL